MRLSYGSRYQHTHLRAETSSTLPITIEGYLIKSSQTVNDKVTMTYRVQTISFQPCESWLFSSLNHLFKGVAQTRRSNTFGCAGSSSTRLGHGKSTSMGTFQLRIFDAADSSAYRGGEITWMAIAFSMQLC